MAAQNLSPIEFESLVIFDIEATGLPDNQRPPRITEFCMLAVNRNELMSTGDRPRVVNTLQICVNPKKPIPLIVSQITGLFNDHLENQKTFDIHLVHLINGFLKRLPPPICLLAHNGHLYDFPLLKAQLLEVNGSLLHGLMCSDSLIAFRDMAGEKPWKNHLPFLTHSKYIGLSNPPRSEDTQCAPVCNTPRPVETSQNIRPFQQVIIDENMNLSADVLPNQNIHINNNSDQVLDLEEMMNSTPPENGLPVVDLLDNNSQDMIITPPRNDSPIWEDGGVREEPAPLLDQVRARHGSPINDDGDMNSLNLRFPNENTPAKRPDIGYMAPRKNIPLKQRIEPGKTRRQLNFELPESIIVLPSVPIKNSNRTKCTLELGKTKRRLDFSLNEHIVQSNMESVSSCSSFQKLNIENCESKPKKMCNTSERGFSQIGITTFNNSATLSQPLQIDTHSLGVPRSPQSSLDDEQLLCAVEGTEDSLKLNILDEKSEKRSPSKILKSNSELSVACGSKTSVQNTFNVTKSFQTITPSASEDRDKHVSYSLINHYTRTFGRPPEISHTSENDCLTLLDLIKRHSPDFMKWVDNHSVEFSEVIPMY